MAVESTPERSFSDLVQELPRGRGDDGVRAALAEMRRRHHGPQRASRSDASDRTGRWRRRPASCRPRRRGRAGWRRPGAQWLVFSQWLRRSSAPSGSTRMSAMFWTSRTSVRRGAPRAADCRRPSARWSDRTAGTRPKRGAPAGGQLPVLALDVVDDGRPGQVSSVGTTRPTPLPRSGRREAQHVLRTVMAQIVATDSGRARRRPDRAARPARSPRRRRPARRAVGRDVLGLARPPHRHADGDARSTTKPPEAAMQAPSTKMRGA